jgi:DTW domain-containing protein YfiP
MQTRTRIVLLMHPKEQRREKCTTGRLVCANLANSEIIPGLRFDDNERVRALIDDPGNQPVLLYPGQDALDLTGGSLPAVQSERRKLVVFLIDGTWACSRKMLHASPRLQSLPRVMFTLEAAGLDAYPDKGRLLEVFNAMQNFQIECELKHRRPRFRAH